MNKPIEMPEPMKRRTWNLELDDMKPGQWVDCSEEAKAAAVVAGMRYRDWVAVRKTLDDGTIRVWRYS